MTRRAATIALLLLFSSCGGSQAQPQGPTAASVAVQPADVPHGLVRCDVSGDIQAFIEKEQSSNPTNARTVFDQWAQLKQAGASAAYVVVYGHDSDQCAAFTTAAGNPNTATSSVVLNFVVQFKDEKKAADAFANSSIFSISASDLRSSHLAVEGARTGLTASSIVISQAISNQSFYIAFWQNRAFVMALIVENMDPATSQKLAVAENARVK